MSHINPQYSNSRSSRRNHYHPKGMFYTNFHVSNLAKYQRAIEIYKEHHPDSPIQFSIEDDAYDMNHNLVRDSKALVYNLALPFNKASLPEDEEVWK